MEIVSIWQFVVSEIQLWYEKRKLFKLEHLHFSNGAHSELYMKKAIKLNKTTEATDKNLKGKKLSLVYDRIQFVRVWFFCHAS